MNNPENNSSWLSEINVTPFVDVLLVLLIIFMVTAPMMTRSVGVNLPKEELVKTKSQEKITLKKSLILGLTSKGQVIYQKKQYQTKQFFQRFKALTKGKEITRIFIQADKTVSYQNLLHLMVFLKNQGYENIGLVFEEI